MPGFGSWIKGSGFEYRGQYLGLEFRVKGLGLRVKGLGFRV